MGEQWPVLIKKVIEAWIADLRPRGCDPGGMVTAAVKSN